ncbi:MAG: helix-turn-helix transcriptional regulator [Candidatus Omnitrophota bacterium]
MKAIWNGEKLLIRRKQVGLTMAELAAKVDCDRPLVSMWEAGKVAPSGHFLVMLGITLNIEPKEFYNLEDEGVQL